MKNIVTKTNYTVLIGRLQPCHSAHIKIIEQALDVSEKIIILLGSANKARDIKNPFTWREREEMIRACFDSNIQSRIIVRGISDTYNDQTWVRSIQETVNKVLKAERTKAFNQDQTTLDNFDPSIALIGHTKDDTSYYLKLFPQWSFINVDNIESIHSTDIRNMMFETEQLDKSKLPTGVFNYIEAFMNSENFTKLKVEYEFIQQYKSSWASAPYAPTFVTSDAVVIQSGHVLLIKRRSAPGKNLFAIPGGFVNQNEKIEDAAIRELREETKLKVPTPVLKGNIKAREVYDNPGRSLRGRTITHAFLIELPPGELPKVKGSDDAVKAKWIPLTVFDKMQEQMFEDHYIIIKDMVGKL